MTKQIFVHACLMVGWGCGAWAADTTTWSEFRGSSRDGSSAATGLPVTWSETENIRWKTALPGTGHSSPVAEKGRIWLTASPDEGKTRHLLCVDFETGKLVKDLPLFTYDLSGERNHKMNSFATPTPIASEGRVYVTFGNPGTACLDAETGQVLWMRRDITNRYWDVGAASSPALYDDKLILTCDGEPKAARFVLALDKNTGKTVWRADRRFRGDKLPAFTHSSGMPLRVKVGNEDQLISPTAGGTWAYDFETGKERWWAWNDTWSVVPRPVARDGLVVMCAGVVKPIQLAVRLEKAKGDITDTEAIAWSTTKNVPDMPSPVWIGKRLYTVSKSTLSCLEPETGRVLSETKLPGIHLASPVCAEGRIYLFNTKGEGSVVEAGETVTLLATNRLDAGCCASPAIVGKSLIVRTTSHLYRIEKK